jgi:putative ABC transport system permease protein
LSSLLGRANRRFLTRHPWQLILSIIGIALGVAVVVAVDLANSSAREAFQLSMQTVTGRVTDEIVGGPDGLNQSLYRRIKVGAGVYPAAPLIEGYAEAGRETLRVLGIAPFAGVPLRVFSGGGGGDRAGSAARLVTQPGTVWLAASTAHRLGVHRGDRLTLRVGGRTHHVHVIGLLRSKNPAAVEGLLVTDIATAQVLFNRLGRIDRIDLRLPQGGAGRAARRRIRALLPPGAALMPAAARTHSLEEMTRAFSTNLTAMSLLALLVGMFLIYNTMTFSVLRRRGLIAGLRALGVTRGEIFKLVLVEAVAIGVAGTLLGLPLGLLLGQALVRMVTRTINDLYFVLTVNQLLVSTWPLVEGALLGVGATVVAALGPTLEAAATPPHLARSRSVLEGRVHRMAPLLAVAGLAVMAFGAGLLEINRSIVLGFFATFLLILGFTLLTPMLVLAALRPMTALLGRVFGVQGRLAGRGVSAGLSRTGVAIAALTVAVATTAGVGVMIDSFRDAVSVWLTQTLRADIYVTVPGAGASERTLSPALTLKVRKLPGVAAVSTGFDAIVDSQFGRSNLFVLDMAPGGEQRFLLKRGEPRAVWRAFHKTRAVLVSEPYAYRHHLAPGDSVRLRTSTGSVAFKVAGVYYDYGSDQGVVLMRRELYRRYWPGPSVSSLGLYLAPGVNMDSLMNAVRRLAAGRRLIVRDSRAIRTRSLAVFDRTFAITEVLRLLTVLVAFVGVLSALMALQLDRFRELATLRATGVTPAGLVRLLLGQTGLMGLIAGVLAVPLGVILAAVLIFVVNRRSFGWTMPFHVAPQALAGALALAVAAALLAGLYPAWHMARQPPAEGLREE